MVSAIYKKIKNKEMKIKLQYIWLLALVISVASCKKDNYKEPTTLLSGKLVYNGDPIGVEYDKVTFELYQYGFGKIGPIGARFDQEGKYSMLLFDGDYKFIIPNGQGPFSWKKLANGSPDSLPISLRGNKVQDIEVTPYFMIRNPQITAGGGKVATTFKAEKIVTGADAKNIERVALFINKTQFVSNSDNVASTTIDGGNIVDVNNITMNVTIPTLVPTQNYIFGRIGLKIDGLDDWLLSPVVKLSF
jgi:hypothetical protein